MSLIFKSLDKDNLEEGLKDAISERWRELLNRSGIDPIGMHSPLWFWSRNGFIFEI
jgi:hypothetical protein